MTRGATEITMPSVQSGGLDATSDLSEVDAALDVWPIVTLDRCFDIVKMHVAATDWHDGVSAGITTFDYRHELSDRVTHPWHRVLASFARIAELQAVRRRGEFRVDEVEC
ncbi:MAG: hypothetical protein CK429_05160 [Mycobacterium sp.]|nr:MAG: hypothetical protein CK429_05160 [Mycobacterium sp.]